MAEKIVKDSQGLAKDIVNDCISRQAAIEALSRCQTYLFDARDTDRKISLEDAEYVIEKLPSAQPETHDKRTESHACDLIDRHPSSSCVRENDTISRRMAIDAIFGRSHEIIKMRIGNLPSAQPERKKGKWVYNSPVTMKCDQCGLVIKDWDWHRFKFCPNCDCDMRGEENG